MPSAYAEIRVGERRRQHTVAWSREPSGTFDDGTPRAAPATTARGRTVESPAGPGSTGIEREHVPPLRSPAFIDGDCNHVLWRGRSSRLIRHRMLEAVQRRG
jgi:hypothetical protein